MNAAERLWRGAARRLGGACGPSSTRRPSSSAPATARGWASSEYIAAHRVAAARGEADEIEVLRSIVDGRSAVIEARVGDRRCAGIYDLHDGRIAGAIEYWA